MRELAGAGGKTADIARQYGVCWSAANKAIKGLTWNFPDGT
jgi:hypothetical protein